VTVDKTRLKVMSVETKGLKLSDRNRGLEVGRYLEYWRYEGVIEDGPKEVLQKFNGGSEITTVYCRM